MRSIGSFAQAEFSDGYPMTLPLPIAVDIIRTVSAQSIAAEYKLSLLLYSKVTLRLFLIKS